MTLAEHMPKFLVAGAPRTATTWLHACMMEHPQIFVPATKEVHFFSFHYDRGLDWYRAQFANRRAELAMGEVSPSYMTYPEADARIFDVNRDMRLLFVVRDPVERAYSHYCMALRNSSAMSRDIEREMRPEAHFVQEGLYHRHISRFVDRFGKSQVKIMVYEDLANGSAQYLHEVFSFLGVDSRFQPTVADTVIHQQKPLPRSARLNRLRLAVARTRWGARIHAALQVRGVIDAVHRMRGKRNLGYPVMPPSLQKRLAEFYEPDVDALSKLLGRDLTFWTNPRARLC